MIVWTKLAPYTDRDFWEERMHALEDASLVISEQPGHKKLKIEIYCEKQKDADALKAEFGGRTSVLKEQDWVALSQQPKSPPLKIRDRLVISEEKTAAGLKRVQADHPKRRVLSIPVEMAFGTGHHATTATCLRLLCDVSDALPDGKWRMLDLGAGTGVLGIAARVLGAKSVTGYDFDPITVDIANKNAASNGVDHIKFSGKDVTQWQPRQQFDCIAANIFFDILIASMPAIYSALKPGGHLILSGILNIHSEECLAAAKSEGLELERVITRGKWVTAHARRPEAS